MKKHTKRTLDLVSKQIIISMFDQAVSFSTKHVPHSHEWLSCGWEIFYFSNLFNCETPSNPSCDTQEKIKYLSFWGCCRCVYFVVNSFFYCTGSRCPGNAFRNRENNFPPVSHCCLPKGEFDVHYYYYLNFYFQSCCGHMNQHLHERRIAYHFLSHRPFLWKWQSSFTALEQFPRLRRWVSWSYTTICSEIIIVWRTHNCFTVVTIVPYQSHTKIILF